MDSCNIFFYCSQIFAALLLVMFYLLSAWALFSPNHIFFLCLSHFFYMGSLHVLDCLPTLKSIRMWAPKKDCEP